jgi:hypothetical protein
LPATFQFSPATSKSIDIPAGCYGILSINITIMPIFQMVAMVTLICNKQSYSVLDFS